MLVLPDGWLVAPDARGDLVAGRDCPETLRWRRVGRCEADRVEGPEGLHACVWRDEVTVVEVGR